MKRAGGQSNVDRYSGSGILAFIFLPGQYLIFCINPIAGDEVDSEKGEGEKRKCWQLS